jgi:hypothetical protein
MNRQRDEQTTRGSQQSQPPGARQQAGAGRAVGGVPAPGPHSTAEGSQANGSRANVWALLFSLVVVALTLVLCLLVARQALTLGVRGEWVWQYRPGAGGAGVGAGLLAELRLPLGLLGILLVLVWCLREAEKALASWDREVLAVVLLVAAGFLFQLASGSIYAGLGQDVLAVTEESVGGYYGLSQEIISPTAFLAGYPRLLATREPVGHLNTHPPGNTMYFYVLRRFFEDHPDLARQVTALEPPSMRGPEGAFALVESQHQLVLSFAERAAIFVGILLVRLKAALVVVPLYLLVRWGLGKRRAVEVAALGVTIPSVVVFLPGLDAAYPTGAAALAALMVGALVWRSGLLAFLAGVALYGVMLFSPALALVAVLVLLWYGLARWTGWGERLRRRPGQASFLQVLGVGILGFAIVLVVLWVFFQFNAVATWWECLRSNARFNRLTGRSYLPWVLYNPVDFLMFLGVGLSALLLAGTAGVLLRLKAWRRWDPMTLGLAVFVLALLALDVGGMNTGEVARLWLFLMPGVALLAACALEGFGSAGRYVLLVVLACQAFQALIFKLYLNVLLMT